MKLIKLTLYREGEEIMINPDVIEHVMGSATGSSLLVRDVNEGSAYGVIETPEEILNALDHAEREELRDRFAAAVMPAFITNDGAQFHDRVDQSERCARRAYMFAEAMLAVRNDT